MTEHEQLIELQPLMEKLGWWPRELSDSDGLDHSYYYDCDRGYERSGIEDDHALSIVVGRAEKELVERGWSIIRDGNAYEGCPSLCLSVWDKGYHSAESLADALRVEIERQ